MGSGLIQIGGEMASPRIGRGHERSKSWFCASVMVVGAGRGSGSGIGAANASVDAYQPRGENEKGLEAIALLWGELWTMAWSFGGSPWSLVLFVSCIFWGFLLVGAWAHQQDGWAVRGPWKRRTDAFSLGGEFTWKKDLHEWAGAIGYEAPFTARLLASNKLNISGKFPVFVYRWCKTSWPNDFFVKFWRFLIFPGNPPHNFFCGVCGDLWGFVGVCGEMWGFVGKCGVLWGNVGFVGKCGVCGVYAHRTRHQRSVSTCEHHHHGGRVMSWHQRSLVTAAPRIHHRRPFVC
jgi:hypothetical protein